jgi:hypothetical protein
MTLRQALLLAGDVTQFGAANRIEIVRNGKKLPRKDIDLDKTIIQPGDTITVPRSASRQTLMANQPTSSTRAGTSSRAFHPTDYLRVL